LLVFGHAGLTLAAAACSENLIRRFGNAADGKKGHLLRTAVAAAKAVDYRLVLTGAFLPDIIDKPVWLLTRAGFQWDGRGYAHTFLANLILVLLGMALAARWNKFWLLTLSLCSLAHLVFDEMWLYPGTLWWPLFGGIERGSTSGWLRGMVDGLLSNPQVWVPEALGFGIVVLVAIRVVANRGAPGFFRRGAITWARKGHALKGSHADSQNGEA
jgi:inner membrane protein